MQLTEKEKTTLKDLQTQEQTCIDKYKKYQNDAKDPVLKGLFKLLEQNERKHYESITNALEGKVPCCDCNDSKGDVYEPKATYDVMSDSADKKADCFLATDSIGSEKMVSSEYNSDVFVFADSAIRKLLADIQIEEQNHAEMLYKYKTVNGMA
ncbi:MAG: ferritin-like domain-containing protein [Lachnospira sp.]